MLWQFQVPGDDNRPAHGYEGRNKTTCHCGEEHLEGLALSLEVQEDRARGEEKFLSFVGALCLLV